MSYLLRPKTKVSSGSTGENSPSENFEKEVLVSSELDPRKSDTENLASEIFQKPKSEKFCPRCNRQDFWRAKQSAGPATIGGQDQAAIAELPWLCWHCEPPPIKSLVHQRRGPLAEALVVERVKECMADVVDGLEAILEQSTRARTVVIAMEAPICPQCSGTWVIESDAGERLKYCCWSCKTEIESLKVFECWKNPENFRIAWKAKRELERAKREEAVVVRVE